MAVVGVAVADIVRVVQVVVAVVVKADVTTEVVVVVVVVAVATAVMPTVIIHTVVEEEEAAKAVIKSVAVAVITTTAIRMHMISILRCHSAQISEGTWNLYRLRCKSLLSARMEFVRSMISLVIACLASRISII